MFGTQPATHFERDARPHLSRVVIVGDEFEDSSRRARRVSRKLWATLMDLGRVLLPTGYVGCGAWDEVVCDRCLAQISDEPQALDLELAGIPDLAVTDYEDVMRRFVLAGKRDPRLDLRLYFAAAGENAAVLAARLGVMRCRRGVFAVPAPSTTPGASSPVAEAFATGIMSGLIKSGVVSQPGVLKVLKMRPGAKRQAGLGYSQQVTNRYHRVTLVTPGADSEFSGVATVLAGDVSTIGSTLREIARVLQGVGIEILGGSVFATSQFSR